MQTRVSSSTGSEPPSFLILFFFNDTATTEIYTLSLHDALPISGRRQFSPCLCKTSLLRLSCAVAGHVPERVQQLRRKGVEEDRKSTRLNSSHTVISYAVFCLKRNSRMRDQRGRRNRPPGGQRST